MAKPRKKDKDAVKWKKKKWYPVLAPAVFNSQLIGETTAFEPSNVVDKALSINLMNLTGEVKNQNVNMRFRIKGVSDGKAQTEVVGYTLSPSFIKRVVRRRHSRIDSTVTIKTKDTKKLVLKPMLITRNRANHSLLTALRQSVREALNSFAAHNNYEDIIKNIIQYRLQLDMRKKLSKIYPLKTFEIKKLDMVN